MDLGLYEQLSKVENNSAVRDATLNPVSNFDALGGQIKANYSIAADNIGNLLVNMAEKDRAVLAKRRVARENINRNTELNPLEKVWLNTKNDFSDFHDGTTYLEAKANEAKLWKKDIEQKSRISGVDQGSTGQLAGDIISELPIMFLGNLKRTGDAAAGLYRTLTHGATSSPINVAKAVALDTAENAITVGGSIFLTDKAFGKSDEEALANAVVGTTMMGAFGAAFGGAKVLHSKLINSATEDMVKQAGGGSIPKGDMPDNISQRVKMQSIDNTVVDDSAQLGDNTPVEMPKVNRISKEFADDQGRQYSEANLLSHQGQPVEKSKVSRENFSEDNHEQFVKSAIDSNEALMANLESYGKVDARFKNIQPMSDIEKEAYRINFKIDLYNDVIKNIKDKGLKERYNDLLTEEQVKLNDLTVPAKKDIDEATKIAMSKVDVGDMKATDYATDIEAKSNVIKKGNKEGYGFGSFHDDMASIHPTEREQRLVSAVESKMDKADYVDAINSLQTRVSKLGTTKVIDPNELTPIIRSRFPEEVARIKAYRDRAYDINKLKAGDISHEEFAWREERRINDAYDIKSNSQSFKTKEDANDFITKRNDELSAIGRRLPETDIVPPKGKGGVAEDNIVDNDYIRSSKLRAYDQYLKTGEVPRYTGNKGSKSGDAALTDSEIVDLDTFVKKGIMSKDELLNKNYPKDVLESKIADVKDTNRQLAKNSIKDYWGEHLGFKGKEGDSFDIKHRTSVYDASNSVGQLVTAMSGDVKLGKSIMTKSGEKEFREKIAENLTSARDGMFAKYAGGPITKDMVKAVYTPKTYGSGDVGAAERLLTDSKTPWFKKIEETEGRDKALEVANAFVKEFNDNLAIEAAGMSKFMKQLKDIHDTHPTGKYSYELPDGVKVEFEAIGKDRYNIVQDGKKIDSVNLQGSGSDKFSRALMPKVLQSLDGYVARRLRNKFGIDTTHDAFHVPEGMEKAVEKEYRQALKDIHDGNVANKIFKQLGGKGFEQEGKLGDDFWFDKDRKFLGPEHIKDELERVTKESYDNLKAGKQLTSTEATLMFMTTKSSRSHDYHTMVDAMIDEAVHSKHDMSIARTKDDPYERALAYALQGKELTLERMVKAPEGLTKAGEDAWYKTQKILYNRFRSAAEYNPNLRKSIKGERKFFNEKGLFIGKTIADVRAIRNLEAKRLAQMTGKDINPEELATERLRIVDDINNGKVVGSDDVETMMLKEVQGENAMDQFAKETNTNRQAAEDMVSEAEVKSKKTQQDFIDGAKKSFDDAMKHIKDKYKNTKEYQQFSDLLRTTRPHQMLADEAGDTATKLVDKLLPKAEQKEFTKHIVETDAVSLLGMDRQSVESLFEKHSLVYSQYKKYIDATANGIAKNENKYGYFMNNAHVMKAELGIDIDVKELDQLISIVAMKNNDSFGYFFDAVKDPDKKAVIDLLKANAERQEAHFRVDDELHNMQKGYIQDSYENAKEYVNGNFRHNAEASYEGGAVGFDTMSSRIGSPVSSKASAKFTIDDVPAGMDPYEFAHKNRLKLTPRGFVSIADLKHRTGLGLTDDLAKRIGNTEASIRKKEAQFNSFVEIMTSDESRFGKLFSDKPTEGFVELTQKQKQVLPKYARDHIKYVNPDYAEKILGREHKQFFSDLYKDATGKDAPYELRAFDEVVKSSVGIFKKNIVLTSISSFKNGFLVNYTTYAMLGGSPKGMIKHSKEAFNAYNEFKNVTKMYDEALASGKMTKDIENMYRDNEVVKMLNAGMSINTLDGVRSDSNIINNFFSEATGGKFDGITNTIMFNQGTFTGDGVKRAFAQIDFTGRYMAFKRLRETADASIPDHKLMREVNDLFGQMDEVAPHLIDIADKYGMAIFAKWAASVLPETARVIKQNPKKSLLIGLGLLVASDVFDVNTDTINPVTSVVDYPLDSFHGDGIAWKQRNMPKLIPGVWRKMFEVGESYEGDKDVNLLWGQRLSGDIASPSVQLYDAIKGDSDGMQTKEEIDKQTVMK